MSRSRRASPDPRHKRLRAVLDGAQLGRNSPRYRWAGTLERLAGQMPLEAWYRLERTVQLRWAADGETRPRHLMRRDIHEFSAMCHRAATPHESIDGLLLRDRKAFATEVADAAGFLAERLSRSDVVRSQTWAFQAEGCEEGQFLLALGMLHDYALSWGELPAWRARQSSGLVYFAHSLRESMRERWQPRRPDWQLIHAAAVAVLGHDLDGIGPEQLPGHVRRLTAASRKNLEPEG